MHALFLIVFGLGLGIGAAVPIGPVNVEIARRTLQRGRWAGMALGFGAVTVDVTFAVVTALGFHRLSISDKLEHKYGWIGVLICFVLAVFSLIAAWRAYKYGVKEPTGGRENKFGGLVGDFVTGLLMTAANIYTWLWWFVTVPQQVAQHTGGGPADLLVVCCGVFVAAGTWVVVFTTIINATRRFAGRRWHIGADLIGGLLLLGFGFWALWRLVDRPL